jgi:fumarate reductase subunit D
MAAAWIPVIHTVGMAYRDAWRAARAIPSLVLVSVAVLLGLNLVQYTGLSEAVRDFPLTVFVSTVVTSLILTPLWIAMYRFLLIADAATDYAIDFKAPRFVRFFAWTVALSLLWLPATLIEYVWSYDHPVTWIVWCLSLLAYAIAAVRLVILFPAIATDAPAATLSNSLSDSRGHFLNVLLLYAAAAGTIVLAVLSCFVIAAIVAIFGLELEGDLPDWVLAVLATVLLTLIPAVIVTVDARVFPVLADRVRRPSM